MIGCSNHSAGVRTRSQIDPQISRRSAGSAPKVVANPRSWPRGRSDVGRDTGSDYLDYCASHRMADDAHVRIRQSGEVEYLSSISTGYFTSDDPAEAHQLREEYFARNRQVAAELRAKGF